MLTAELILKTGSGEKVFEMSEGGTLFAGRSAECDLYLPSPAVSRRHAVFLLRRGQCGIKDLDSSNGTYLNGKRIMHPLRLKDGDSIQIANFIIEFRNNATGKRFHKADQTVILDANSTREVRQHSEMATSAAANDDALTIQEENNALSPSEIPYDPPTEIASLRPVARPEPTRVPAPSPMPPPAPEPEPVRAKEPLPVVPAAPPEPVKPTPAAEAPPVPPAKPDPAVAQRASESIRLVPKPPHAPKLKRSVDDEVGDGSGDAAFMADAAVSDEPDKELALAKAAAEAGLVGEFVPDTGEDIPAEPGGIPAQSAPSLALVASPGEKIEFPKEREADPNAIPISKAFRSAIESRLFLYSFLADMKTEREQMIAANPGLPDAVKAELARQDREKDKLPPAEKAEEMIGVRLKRRDDLKVKIKEAKEAGLPMPARPSKEMRQAEEIAINQWTLIAQSAREALPAVYVAGFRVMEGEPLAKELADTGIDAKTLLGGAAYLLALGELLEETKYNRAFIKAKLATTSPPLDKKQGGGKAGGMFGFLGRRAGDEDGDEDDEVAPGESYQELVDTEAQLAQRVGWINQESAWLELNLIKEFWVIYTQTAVYHIAKDRKMPLAVRAFLRHGAVGFKKWWMNEPVRQHVLEDCGKDVVEKMEVAKTITNILYADEYLSAVRNLECTPSMDENLEINCRNSPEWRADKALRKLIYSRSQQALMGELRDSLSSRMEKIEQKAAEVEERLKNLLPGSKNFKAAKTELSHERQAYRVEVSKLSKLAEKIRDKTLADLAEVVEETEERFDSGELPRPTPEFLVERECEAVRRIGRLLANLKERFLPLVLRDSYQPDTDALNDRLAINGEIADIERRDPAIFLENIIPSKKKANRVDIRISPVVVLLPSAGILAFSWNPRQKPEDGRLAIPTCFIRPRLRERQLTYLMSDFRWDTSKASAGMDVMNSETIVAGFMSVRWDWRKRSKEGREKGLVYTDQNDRTNWRRVYESYLQTAYDGGKKLYNRNYDFYERIIGKYFDMPEGVDLLRK